MKTFLQSILFSLLFVAFFYLGANAQTQWVQKANFGGSSRYLAASFSIGTKGYLGTGWDLSVGITKDFWEYDPSTNVWTQKADFGGIARAAAIGLAIGSKGYIGLGFANGVNYKKDFWEYDPSTNIWTEKANFGGSARASAAGFTIGTKGYVGTGFDTTTIATDYYTQDFWEYDQSSNVWTAKANFGGGVRLGAIGFSIGTKGYLGTGNSDNNTSKKDLWEWNQSTNTWTQMSDIPYNERVYASAFAIGTNGYVIGGTNLNSHIDFWQYDQTSDSWKGLEEYPGNVVYGSIACAIGSKGYVGTGIFSNPSNNFYEYTPPTIKTGTVLSSYDCMGSSISVSVPFTLSGTFISGNVFTAQLSDETGGFTFPTSIGTLTGTSAGTINATITIPKTGSNFRVRIISSNPATVGTDNGHKISIPGAWNAKTNFGGSARQGAIGFSIGTKGYVGTGTDNTSSFTNDFWEYDQGTDTWTQKANFGGAARAHAVGFSIGDKGYIGTGRDGAYMNDFWEYNPAANTWTAKANFGGTARTGAVGFSIGNKGYIGTGYDGAYKNDFWEWDKSSNTWVQKTSLSGTARQAAVGFSIGTKGYIGTGTNGTLFKDFWQYNQANDTWSQKQNFGGVARRNAVGFFIGTRGFIGTGDDGVNGGLDDFWEYDENVNSWQPSSTFAGGTRKHAVGFSIESTGYIGTGLLISTAAPTNTFYEYKVCSDPVIATGTLSSTNVCAGQVISIPFTALGAYDSNNEFTAQLSDATGSFSSYTTLGNLFSTTAITMYVHIPQNTPTGRKYRIRISSTTEATKGIDNGSDLTISSDCGTLSFDGNDDRAFVQSNSAYDVGTGDFTIEAWITPSLTSGSTEPIVSRGNGLQNTFIFSTYNSGTQLSFYINSSNLLSSTFTNIYDDNCHHVAVKRSGSGTNNITFYVDGVAQGTATNSTSLTASTPLRIGYDAANANAFKGNISDVRFWNVARTTTEILNNKNLNLAGNTTNLKGYWLMNESSGQVIYDASLTQNNGRIGSTDGVDAQDPTLLLRNKCFVPLLQSGLIFDGTNNKAIVPHSDIYNFENSEFTLEAWIKPTSGGTTSREIMSKRTASIYANAFLFSTWDSGTKLLLQIDGNNMLSTEFTGIHDNSCHHVAVVRSGNATNNVTFYVDGVAKGTATNNNSINITSNFRIGHDQMNLGYFNGNINEVRIWRVARTAIEISENKGLLQNINTSIGLVGYWKFEEPSGQVIIDASSNGNNGYLGYSSTQFDSQEPTRTTNTCFSSDRMAADISYEKTVTDSISIKRNDDNYQVYIYPNPFNNQTSILINGTEGEKSYIKIIDITGKLIYEENVANNESISIGMELPLGIYTLMAFDNCEKQYKVYKIIKVE